MIQNYSYSNLEAMINSIYSNAEIIQKMLKSVKEQETEITYKMQSYAKVKRLFPKIKLNCIEIMLVIRMKWKTNLNFIEMI